MINEEEYKQVKLLGETVGYLLENNLDNLKNNYELKQNLIKMSVNYSINHDLIYLRNQFNSIELPEEIKEKLYSVIQTVSNLNGEKAMIYSNSVLIPNDIEFIEHQKLLEGSKELSALYHVPSNVVASKIMELNKYAKEKENIVQK